MNRYTKLHGEELLLKIRGFGKLDSENKISKAIFQCGYYHKNLSNKIVLEPKEFAIAFHNARIEERKSLETHNESLSNKSDNKNSEDPIKKDIFHESDEYFEEKGQKIDSLKFNDRAYKNGRMIGVITIIIFFVVASIASHPLHVIAILGGYGLAFFIFWFLMKLWSN